MQYSVICVISSTSFRSYLSHQPSRVPVHLQSVAALANQLLRSGTSIGANNAEACNAISKADFKSKSYIALKEARESLYWIELLKRNNYIDEKQYQSIYEDCDHSDKISRFEETYEDIIFSHLDDSLDQIHYAINDLDNAIYEIDMYAPMAFFDVERQLAPIIKRSPKKGDDFSIVPSL